MDADQEGKLALVKVMFDPTPMPVDRTWGFQFWSEDDDTPEVVSGFLDEAAAKAWIASHDCDAWLEARGLTRELK
jgi:hypothetical protein